MDNELVKAIIYFYRAEGSIGELYDRGHKFENIYRDGDEEYFKKLLKKYDIPFEPCGDLEEDMSGMISIIAGYFEDVLLKTIKS